MRVIVTGSRHWTNYSIISTRIGNLPYNAVIVHGGAPGADTIAGNAARECGCRVLVYNADWEAQGKRAGSRRNQRMIDGGADLVLAFPMPESRGTWDCVRRAEKAEIPVEIIYPKEWEPADQQGALF